MPLFLDLHLTHPRNLILPRSFAHPAPFPRSCSGKGQQWSTPNSQITSLPYSSCYLASLWPDSRIYFPALKTPYFSSHFSDTHSSYPLLKCWLSPQYHLHPCFLLCSTSSLWAFYLLLHFQPCLPHGWLENHVSSPDLLPELPSSISNCLLICQIQAVKNWTHYPQNGAWCLASDSLAEQRAEEFQAGHKTQFPDRSHLHSLLSPGEFKISQMQSDSSHPDLSSEPPPIL